MSLGASHFATRDYQADSALSDTATLARNSAGKAFVLKPLPADCLLQDQLHPMIRDRLERVRQLAHLGVAQLHGVEAIDGAPYLVWDYLDGVSLEEYATQEHPEEQRHRLARELVRSVQALHHLGIVHGALSAGNVIITPNGDLRITHISPLLYTEVESDLHDLPPLLELLGFPQGEGDSPPTLDQLAQRLMAKTVLLESDEDETDARRARRLRIVALAAAAVTILVAGLVTYSIYRLTSGENPPPATILTDRPNRAS